MAVLSVAVDAHPRVLGALRVEREEERLSRPEIRLPLALVILQVTLEPARGTVCAKYLKERWICRLQVRVRERYSCHSPHYCRS